MSEDVLEMFKFRGNQASFHYADDSGSEWGEGAAQERAARALFAEHEGLQAEMRDIAKGFLWKL